ncbi:MAG: hypothetical protein ABI467_22425 [Kofleriaceae bacterium]
MWFAISIASMSCSSPAKPEPPSAPQRPATPVVAPFDAGSTTATPDATSATVVDDKFPRIFPWAMWRARNEKWLATTSDNHCDPRHRHVRRKGESECYPPINVQLAGIVVEGRRSTHDEATTVLTVDRGYSSSVTSDYYISVLDPEDRPATKWVHPSLIERNFAEFELPLRTGVSIERGTTRAAVVEELTMDDRFPDGDPRSQP